MLELGTKILYVGDDWKDFSLPGPTTPGFIVTVDDDDADVPYQVLCTDEDGEDVHVWAKPNEVCMAPTDGLLERGVLSRIVDALNTTERAFLKDILNGDNS